LRIQKSSTTKPENKEVIMRHRRDEKPMPEAQLRRNILTIRFRDAEHRAISNAAWERRMTMSGWVRDIALSRLEEEGKLANAN